MSMKLGLVVCFTALPALCAAEAFEDAVIRQLRCDIPPSPLPILAALADAGVINPADNLGYDSLSCFEIAGGIMIAGLRFDTVCGFEDRQDVQESRPDLLYRGPGTSPGQTLSFGTDQPFESVRRWYIESIGTQHVADAVGSDWTTLGDETEVRCTDWFADF
jgi:hypothetical protein